MKTTLLPYLENIKRMSKILSKFITELTDQSKTLEVVIFTSVKVFAAFF